MEEEYQIVNPEARELQSYVSQILEKGKLVLREQLKSELMQSVVEVGTCVCRTAEQARAEIQRLRGSIIALARRQGAEIVAAGTHPFSS